MNPDFTGNMTGIDENNKAGAIGIEIYLIWYYSKQMKKFASQQTMAQQST